MGVVSKFLYYQQEHFVVNSGSKFTYTAVAKLCLTLFLPSPLKGNGMAAIPKIVPLKLKNKIFGPTQKIV